MHTNTTAYSTPLSAGYRTYISTNYMDYFQERYTKSLIQAGKDNNEELIKEIIDKIYSAGFDDALSTNE